MPGETIITVIGNLTADPELRTTASGAQVASFTVASTPRTWNRNANQYEDGATLFMRCSAWRDLAEHVANSLTKGTRVIVQGRLTQSSYTDRNGNQRSSLDLQVDEIGPSLRYATAQVTRIAAAGGFRPDAQFSGQSGVVGGFAQPSYQGGAGYQAAAGYQGGSQYQQPMMAQPPVQPPVQAAPASVGADPWGAGQPESDEFGPEDPDALEF